MLLMYLLQPLPGDMGVDLSRRDVGMAEHDLDGSQVRTMFEEVTRKGMSQRVGIDLFPDARCQAEALDDLPETLSREGLSARIEEQVGCAPLLQEGRPPVGHVFLKGFQGLGSHGDHPFLGPFSQGSHITGLHVHIADLEIDQFGDSQPCSIEEFQHGLVSLSSVGVWVRLRK